jgi:2-C-methyl-D-erythritol 4-phosphate cytidylyltransferase
MTTQPDAVPLSPDAAVPSTRRFALLPCAGQGARAGGDTPKQYQALLGQPMVLHTLAAFRAVSRIAQVWIVVAPGDEFLSLDSPGVTLAHCGGSSRAASVFNGLQALREAGAHPTDWVLVHDAARCLITPAQITALMDACEPDPVGGLLALKLADTLKAEAGGRVVATIDRADKWLAQTPQMFRIGLLQAALQAQAATGFAGVTDEASAMEMAGHAPRLVSGGAQNFKVTYPEDFALAEAILRSRL